MGNDQDPQIRNLTELAEAVGGVEHTRIGHVSQADFSERIGELAEGAWIDYDPDLDTEIRVVVERVGYELVYPFALSHFWNVLWDLAWAGIEMEIEELEGFQVTVTTRFDCDGPGWTTDYNYPGHYPYERAAAGTTTVAGWLRQRFRRQYGDTEVKVKRPDYSVAPGQLRLSTLRGL
jgi:hypothetical protein